MHDGRNALRTGNGSLVWLSGPLATGLAWAAHTASGGQSPAVLIVLALAALLGMAASMVGPRQLPAWAVLVVAGLAQQLLHLAFAAFSVSNGVALPGHGHGGAPDVPPAEPGVSGAPHILHLMLHLHMGAALVTMAVVTQWNKLGKLNRAFPGIERSRTCHRP